MKKTKQVNESLINDLLEVLKQVEVNLEYNGLEEGDTMLIVRAAIAKAEGKE